MTAAPIAESELDTLLAPLRRFPRLALAVSGGPDSLALMHLVRFWCGDPHTITVLTVDHALRDGSRSEAETVARLAREMGLRHEILTWEHGEIGTGIQARARAARYDLMAAACVAHDIPTLVTAHHLDDCAETLLMRLKRGSGLDGLAAIPEEGSWAGLRLLRPLLHVPKARLVATAAHAGLPAVSDPSNADPRFERARLRDAMATLQGLGFTPEAIALSAKRLARARASLDAGVEDFLQRHGERAPAGYASVDLHGFRSVPEEIALRALQRLIGTVGGARQTLRLAKTEALLAAVRADPHAIHTLGRCQLVTRKGRLFVFRELRRNGLPALALHPGQRRLWDNRFAVALSAGAPAPVTVRALGDQGVAALKNRETGAPAHLALRNVPRLALRTLPACWGGGGLLGLPDFDQGAGPHAASRSLSRHEGGFDCRAVFLWDLR